jgi:hypothetical protein
MMTGARQSFLKTTYLAFGGAVISAIAAMVIVHAIAGALALPLSAIAWAGCIACLCVFVGGLVVLHREGRASRGRPDLFLELNGDRSESALSRLGMNGRFPKSVLRLFARDRFVVGDLVEIQSLENIRRTLDADGTLDGVPFMTEMIPFCGRKARVLRCVDKVYDYGRSKTLRRLRDCVLLAGTRCDGAAHNGCQARCSVFWKTAWLRPASPSAKTALEDPVLEAGSVLKRDDAAHAGKIQQQEPYICQYTQVAAASAPMRSWDIRQDLRPLFSGNVSFPGFCVALLTWLFNRVQGLRGGTGFPEVKNSGLSKTPIVNKNIGVGDPVSVLGMDAIGMTLDATYRNRGLWFDREMVKHCGQPNRVLQRVDRIIDDANGRMVPMKTPCIMLDDVVASGEFLRFLAQQEYLFWRESWLKPASEKPAGAD